MLHLLLDQGADLNQIIYGFETTTVWGSFLDRCYEDHTRSGPKKLLNLYQVCEMIILQCGDANTSSCKAEDVFHKIFTKTKALQLEN
jgi:hypothetical protein